LRRNIPKQKRTLASLVPYLPTTFAPGQTLENFKKKSVFDESKNELGSHHHYPFRYYEICLHRSLIGLSGKTKVIANALGLFRRHQVVSVLVSSIGLASCISSFSWTDIKIERIGNRAVGSLYS
jgi:hypothetical protein